MKRNPGKRLNDECVLRTVRYGGEPVRVLWCFGGEEDWRFDSEEGNHEKKKSFYVAKSYSISKVKLATIVEGDPKAPFSIATTPRCRGGRYSIPWIAPLYP